MVVDELIPAKVYPPGKSEDETILHRAGIYETGVYIYRITTPVDVISFCLGRNEIMREG